MPSDQQVIKSAQWRLVVPEIAIGNLPVQHIERSSDMVIFIGPEKMSMSKPQACQKYDQRKRYSAPPQQTCPCREILHNRRGLRTTTRPVRFAGSRPTA